MTEKIKVKLCSHRAYKSFIAEHTRDKVLTSTFLIPENLNKLLNDIPSYEVVRNASIKELALQVWSSEQLIKKEKKSLTFRQSTEDEIRKSFYCYQYGGEALSVSMGLGDLKHFSSEELILVYKDERILPINSNWDLSTASWGSMSRKRKEQTTFNDYVTAHLKDASRGMKAVLVGAADGKMKINEEFRDDYHRYVKAAASNLNFSVLEKTNQGWGKKYLDYWADQLDKHHNVAYQLLGYTRSMPYTTKELKQILPRDVKKEGLPCFLIYRNLVQGHIAIPIPDDVSPQSVFEAILETLLHVKKDIEQETLALRALIASQLEVVEPFGPYAYEPGSQARMKEALARSRAKKVSEPIALAPGQVLKEDLLNEVDRIFQFKGAELTSFDYFKEKFLEAYPVD